MTNKIHKGYVCHSFDEGLEATNRREKESLRPFIFDFNGDYSAMRVIKCRLLTPSMVRALADQLISVAEIMEKTTPIEACDKEGRLNPFLESLLPKFHSPTTGN